jgi:aspartate aminotransferase
MPVADAIQESMTRASWIRKMFERGAELKRIHGEENVYDFSLGNPVLEPPTAFFDMLSDLSGRRDEGLHRYMPNAGFPEVRQAIADKLQRSGIFPGITARHVVMSVGAGGGLNSALKAVLNPGDEVVVLAPYFVEYLFYIANHGGVPVTAQTNDRFDIDIDAVAAVLTPKTKGIIVNTPNNPTGRLFPRSSLEALGALLEDREKAWGHPIYLITDEPYRELVYVDDAPPSAAMFHRNAFLVYSWSKSLSIPGERIGYVAINPAADDREALADAVTFTTRTLGFVNAPAMAQLAVGKLVDVTVDVSWYRQRRDRLLASLRDMGFDIVTPEGTFYIFPKAPGPDDIRFVADALEARVLLVPGSGFGRRGYFRLAYCVDDRTIDGGLEALGNLMGSLQR